jgi:hypothetical protein
MLPDTLALVAGTYNKVAADTQSGTLYTLPLYGASNPHRILVNHTIPRGSSGNYRHLIQVSSPLSDGTDPLVQRCTVNLTVTYPAGITIATDNVPDITKDLLKLVTAGYTGVSTNFSNILTGMY